jgi:signal transduction histidine kinase/CheY-like chemotaxis protein
MRRLRQYISRRFLPDELRNDAGTEVQAVRSIAFGLSMLFWVPVFVPIYYWLGSTRAALMVAIVGVAIVGAMWSLRITKSPIVTGNLLAGSVFAVLIALTCVTGGLGSVALWWLAAVPIIGLILCSVRSGVIWAVCCCLACVAFFAFASSNVSFPNDIGGDNQAWLDVAAVCGIILCAFTLTLVFHVSEANVRRDLETARDASQQASRAKSAFLANMSHEIRTPMNAIMGMTDLVLDTDLKHEQREYLNVVQQSSDALLVLLNDILDFSKIEAGKLELAHKPFDLHESLGDIVKAMAVRAHQQGLELVCEIPHDVPRVVVGDQGRLRQVVVNLVGNAIKFTDQGQVVFVVQCGSRSATDTWLNFTVSDTGVGIPANKQQVIFELFEQADTSTTRRFGGTGLGLAISAELVRMMGGQIGVESEVGRGSTFRFNARFGVADDDSIAPPLPCPVELRDLPVLIVDDNAANRHILREITSSWGMQPTVAASAQQALDLLEQAQQSRRPFQLVLTDAHMPGMDGFMLSECIKRNPLLQSTIVMMLTSGDLPGDIARCDELGINSYLLKPIKRSELLQVVVATLRLGRAAQERIANQAELAPLPSESFRILLVEDSLVNQKLAVAMLQKNGHRVVVANNGCECLKTLETEQFDVILMDIQMPEMDGLEAARAIRQAERSSGDHIPIIAMTAHALKSDQQRCLDAGMDEYITKPINARKVLETIAAVISRETRQSALASIEE